MTHLTRRYPFSASHRLHSARLDGDANRRVYGKCNNPFGHGHNYYLEVTVAGEADAKSGLLAPVSRLDAYVREAALSRLDHVYLNDLPEFAAQPPTTENLGFAIGRRLARDWPADLAPARLAKVRLVETGSNSVEIAFS
jgi:6-pyruvoyltetrahydropterin/6-carboxytetrahydropterin synthase